MKRAGIALLALVILAAACIVCITLLHRAGTALDKGIQSVAASVEREDYALAQTAFQNLSSEWRQSEPIFLFFTGRKHSGPVRVLLARIEGYLAQQKSSELLAELSELRSYLEHTWDSHALSPENLL